MSRMVNGATSFLLTLGAAYFALVLYTYFNQTNMLYLPDFGGDKLETTPVSAGLEYQNLALHTEDGLQLHGWFVPAENERGVVLFCHGNAGNISHRIDTLRIFHDLGLSSLIFDYRGYGRSEGKPSEAGTYRDAEAAWQFLLQKGYNSKDIIIMGRSLGAAVAAELSQRHQPGALVLESTFTSVPDLAGELYPYLPARWLSRFRYETIKRLPSIHAPILIVHSSEDDIIPFHHGQSLFKAANEPKQFLVLKGGHNDGIYITGEGFYQKGLDDFFTRYLRHNSPAPSL